MVFPKQDSFRTYSVTHLTLKTRSPNPNPNGIVKFIFSLPFLFLI